jgi:hydrogenase nickel incorporation protein HypA/HybF
MDSEIMHEMSIAENIKEIVIETLADMDTPKLKSVTIEVGELTAVIPESLEFCFQIAIERTSFKGAKLNIVEQPLMGECTQCTEKFKIRNFSFICPSCQSSQIKVTGGQELNVTELEVE